MNKKAFSLIELIVGITISMILMVSVGVFINNGMQNIFMQQEVLKNMDHLTDFAGNLNTSFNLIQSDSFPPQITGSGIIFKRGQNFGEGGFSYIGTEKLNEIYCETDSENTITNSVFQKTFIPFEEDGEDIFSNYNEVLTATEGNYTSHQKEHVIKENGVVIVGKGVFGDNFTEGVAGTDIYLNSPTGLAYDGTNLYIADTHNNRILYLDNSKNIHLLLDAYDGLNEPTGLYYNSGDDALYISNSGNGEILKYSSETISNPNSLSLSFSGVTASNVDNFKTYFYNKEGPVGLTSPTNKSDLSFSSNINNNKDYLLMSGNKLEYYFSNFNNPTSTFGPGNINNCSDGTTYSINSGVVSKEEINCTDTHTGTIIITNGPLDTGYDPGTTYDITINNINFSSSPSGTSYINIKLYDGLTEKYSEYFSYYTSGDGDLTTTDDNILEIIHSGLNYPTGIWGANNYNEFGDGTYDNLDYNSNDSLLGTPIKSLGITNNGGELITLILKYFKTYNCYNLDDKSERTYILKKNLK